MSGTATSLNNNNIHNGNHSMNNGQPGYFARRRWSHVLVLADQLRHNTQEKKNEQLRQYAFDIPLADGQESIVTTSIDAQTDRIKSFQNELLSAKAGYFNLDNLTKHFLRLQVTYNRMLELNKDGIEQVTLATSITKTFLLIVLRVTESIVEIVTKGTRHFPTLNSLISYIRSRHVELPINGSLLVDWYKAAHILDLLLDDVDWLVKPPKAYWAMQVCNETLAWARAVFNENYRKTPKGRPIFDRDDSMVSSDSMGQE